MSPPSPTLHTVLNGGRRRMCVCDCVRVAVAPYIGHCKLGPEDAHRHPARVREVLEQRARREAARADGDIQVASGRARGSPRRRAGRCARAGSRACTSAPRTRVPWSPSTIVTTSFAGRARSDGSGAVAVETERRSDRRRRGLVLPAACGGEPGQHEHSRTPTFDDRVWELFRERLQGTARLRPTGPARRRSGSSRGRRGNPRASARAAPPRRAPGRAPGSGSRRPSAAGRRRRSAD